MRSFLHLQSLMSLLAVALVALAIFAIDAAPAYASNHRTIPSVPQNVQATPGNQKLTLTWSEPSSWGSFPAYRYEIDVATSNNENPPASGSNDWESLANPATTATSYTFTGTIFSGTSNAFTVTNGTKYHLRIRSVTDNPDDPGDVLPSIWVYASSTPAVQELAPGVAGLIAVPSSLTIPVGSRACYVLKPNTLPTHSLTVTAVSTALTGKATVTEVNQATDGWTISGNTPENLNTGVAYCVEGTTAGSGAITHSVASTDTNYNGITVPSVLVTVTAADTKPTVRFLHSEMRVLEGDTTTPGSRNIHDLSSRAIKVKLDIAPAPTSSGVISIHTPSGYCTRPPACLKNDFSAPATDRASRDVDYRALWLPDLQVPYTSGSNDMEFTFWVISDNSQEADEGLKMYLVAEWFEPSHSSANGMGFVANTDVCIGACTSPSVAQQSTTVTIIDDDGSDHVNHPWAQMGGDVGTYRPDGSRVWENIGLVTTEEENEPSQDQNQEQEEDDTPNRAPTVAAEFSDVTIVSESGTEDVLLFFISDNSPSPVFDDPDGDELTITAASSDEDVATASVASRSTLKVSAKSRGTATITVTADDGEGGTVSDAFDVTVKAAPTVASGLSDVSGLEAGTAKEISLSGVFSDPDGDALEIDAISSDDDVATVAVALDYSKLTVTGVAEGETTITVLATDSDGNLAGTSFDVSVSASQPLLIVPPAEQAVAEQNDYSDLIAQMKEWREDPKWRTFKAHTDRWDRALMAFGETVDDQTLTKMSAAEAQAFADKGWTRWVGVAEALRELEATQ